MAAGELAYVLAEEGEMVKIGTEGRTYFSECVEDGLSNLHGAMKDRYGQFQTWFCDRGPNGW